MWKLIWTCILCCLSCIFAIVQLDITNGEEDQIPMLGKPDKRSQRLFQRFVERPGDHGLLRRHKRNVFLSSGVRLCSQETVQQAVTNHLKYYKLRVCQEIVWESFKIFLDRLPNQEEYKSWMNRCQTESVSIQEIGATFSQSEEHLALIHRRLAQTRLKSPEESSQEHVPPGDELPAETTVVVTTVVPHEVISESVKEVTAESPSAVMTVKMDTEITNEIEQEAAALPSRPLIEQRVELAMLLTGEPWSEELLNSTSSEHGRLTQKITKKISAALEKLTEFKSVSVVDIRPQMDPSSGDKAVLVEYVVSLQTSSEEISSETLDFINLQSNMVEGTFSYSEGPTVQYTIIDLHPDITETLHGETSPEETHSADESLDPDHKDDILAVEEPSELPGEVVKEDFTVGDLLDSTMSEEEDLQDKDLVSQFPPSQTLSVEGEAVGPIIDSKQDSDLTLDDFNPASGSGEDGDWVTVLAGAQEPVGETEDDEDILIDVDTPQIEDYEFSTITTVVEEDQILPEETPELITAKAEGDGNLPAGSDIPTMPPVKVAEAESTLKPEEDLMHSAEEEGVEEDNKEETVLTEKNEETEVGSDVPTMPPVKVAEAEFTLKPEEDVMHPAEEERVEEDNKEETILTEKDEETEVGSDVPTMPPVKVAEAEFTLKPEEDLMHPAEEERVEEDNKEETVLTEKDEETKVGSDVPTMPPVKVAEAEFTLKPEEDLMHPAEEERVEEDNKEETVLTEKDEETKVGSDVPTMPPVKVAEAEFTLKPEEDLMHPAEEERVEDDNKEETVLTEKDKETKVGSDVPTMPPVKVAEAEFTLKPEEDLVHPAEEERVEEDNKEETILTEKDEETEVSVITIEESEEVEEEEQEESVDSTTVAQENDFVLMDVSTIQFSEDVLTEDEILLVTIEPASPVYPTPLSPEKEPPFSLITIMTPTEVELVHTLNSDVMTTSLDVIHYKEEEGSGISGVIQGDGVSGIALPANPGRSLIVFFSLRVTNMIFSEDLFNKSSAEYKALEQQFLELLVPYLQSNLSHFENLEILNFRNGSIVVNSRMKFGKPVPHGVITAVYLILEDFCNTAYQTMNLAIDKYSLDVESGEQADPCKFQACNEFAECTVNQWSGEAECVCNAGYFSVDGLPCQSICDLQHDFCLNDGKCDVIPGQGAICRCRVGENWWYRGEHCEEYVSEPLVVGIAIASVAGFLLVASGVIFFLARTLRDQYDKDEMEDPVRREDSPPFLDRATKYNPMFESDLTTGYSHYYQRYPEPPVHSSASAETSTEFSSEEIRHIYENSELTKEDIQDRIRILELYTRDRQFADFLKQHQIAMDNQRESSSNSQ
ncbi:interphotoreceptor matrix proteoglycan 2 isoform X2 [Labeo rohita]|uniref:interphotoreceptor matrix proteoglycan 2 isoform X2 n=1 Tax=Labeo rohita TaxID=84645 RepID=UPI0021E241C4|nr:interphotoreceptor matrix proteoglycan 2 isoform X2 [Labeo rohita]